MSDRPQARRSIFAGLLLILLGLVFLLNRFDPTLGIGHMIRFYWPVLIVVWGVAKLIDHLGARSAGQLRPALLSGREAALMVLFAFVLAAFVFRDWLRDHYPDADFELPPFHESFSQSRQLAPQSIPNGAHVLVETARGNISVHVGDSNQLRVSINESASAPAESAADERMKQVDVLIEQKGGSYSVHPVRQYDSQGTISVDLDLEVPKTVSISAHTNHGDISVSAVTGSVDAHSDRGDVEIHDVGSDVTADLKKGDARISGISGNVEIAGRGSDIEVEDVAGNANVEGVFLGTTRVGKVGKTLHCKSPWADLTIERMNGRLDVDSGQIELSDAAGPVKIVTHDKDINVENVTGRLEISDSHGDIKVGYTSPPREEINIANETGTIEVMLPSRSSFQISAVSRSGEVESDFEGPALKPANEEDTGKLNGQFGGRSGAPGPKITISTSYGTIQLRKSA
ncbi:MAG TPA: DUF4097 family beta strand repeat-containing protein [Candidatus Acidoferrales bacterium]|nr:DUF4097 family beta strand repeat-containing protein [Candidatus Acidoferrales bacterium]